MLAKIFLFGVFLAVAPLLCFGADCSQYLGRGYCTDYIQQATGQRQGGDARFWAGDRDLTRLRDGDVAIFDYGTYGHVALISRVNRDANGTPVTVNLAEWNYGSEYTNEACAVTNEFGILRSTRVVAVSAVTRFWHIGTGALPSVTMCAWTSSGKRVCWKTKNGEDRSCENATAWYTSNPVTRTSGPASASICPSACYTGPNVSSILDFLVSPAYAGGTLSTCARRETGSDYVFGTSSPGAGSSTPATDSPKSGKPNFVGRSIRLFDTSGRERYTFKKTESIVARCEIANNGTKNIPDDDDVTTMFLLSKGYKEDPHGDWKKINDDH